MVEKIENEGIGESSINLRSSEGILIDYDIIQAENFVIIHENCTVRFSEKDGLLKIFTGAHKPIILEKNQKNIFLNGFVVSFPSFGELSSKTFEDAGYRLAVHPPPKRYKNRRKVPHNIIHYIPNEMRDYYLYNLQKEIQNNYRKRVEMASRVVKRYLSLNTPILLEYAEKRLDRDFFKDIERDILYRNTHVEDMIEDIASKEPYKKEDMIHDLKMLQGVIEGGYMKDCYYKVIREVTMLKGYSPFMRENKHKARRKARIFRKKRHPLNVAADYIGHCLYDISRAALTLRGLDPNITILHHSSSDNPYKQHGQKLAMDLVDFDRGLIMLYMAELFRENSRIFSDNLLPYIREFKDGIFNSSEPDISSNIVQKEQGFFEKGQRSSIHEDGVYDSEDGEFLPGGVKRLFNAFYQVLQKPHPYFPGMSILDSLDYHIDFIINNMRELSESGEDIGKI